MKQDLYKFLKKFIILLGIVIALDFSIGKILNTLYFNQISGYMFRTTYTIEKTTADVLIFGSSRANHHYNPEILSKQLKMSVYNAGKDGSSIIYHYSVFKSIMKRYKPKVIILDISVGEFNKTQNSYDRLSPLLPYYQTHPEIRPIVQLKSRYEKIKMLSSIYPFNSSIFSIVAGNTQLYSGNDKDINGYIPLYRKLSENLTVDTTNWTLQVDPVKEEMFCAFIDECIKSGIQLFIICSPYHLNIKNQDKSIALISKITHNNSVPFFNFSSDSLFLKSTDLFSDRVHLNSYGAGIFSNLVADSILTYQCIEYSNLKHCITNSHDKYASSQQ